MVPSGAHFGTLFVWSIVFGVADNDLPFIRLRGPVTFEAEGDTWVIPTDVFRLGLLLRIPWDLFPEDEREHYLEWFVA